MADTTSAIDPLSFASDYQGQVQGINLLRADTAVAAGNPSNARGDSVTIGSDSPRSSSPSYVSTAATNKASAAYSRATSASNATSGQQQELQTISAVARMQRAYAIAQVSISSAEARLKHNLPDVSEAVQNSLSQSLRGSALGASVGQAVANVTPALHVATNATASSMVLAQQPQLTGVAQARPERDEARRMSIIAASDDIDA